MLTLRSALVAVALSACGSDAPQQDPDDGVPRLHPGPCGSSRGEPFPETCVMTYEEDLLVLTECQSFGDRVATAREYEDGQLSHIVRTGSESAEWTFGDPPEASTRVVYGDSLTTIEEDMVFEPGVVFTGHPHDPDGLLSAPDSLVSFHHERTEADVDPTQVFEFDVTYTFDGPARQGLRTRTGSDGSIATFQYDEAGRLLQARQLAGEWWPTNATPPTYVYEEGRLVEIRDAGYPSRTYSYDEPGNLVSITTSLGVITLDYGCW